MGTSLRKSERKAGEDKEIQEISEEIIDYKEQNAEIQFMYIWCVRKRKQGPMVSRK